MGADIPDAQPMRGAYLTLMLEFPVQAEKKSIRHHPVDLL